MKKTSSILIASALIILLGVIFAGGANQKGKSNLPVPNTEIKNGVQYITINASGGYSPQLSEAQANIPTKLIVKTNGTYDCSAALVIRSVGFQEVLPQTGSTEIDIGVPQKGKPLTGVCSMGMYSFKVDFI